MIFVDTGHLAALLNPRDQLNSRAAEWSRSLRERMLTSEYVLWELINQFSGQPDRAKLHEVLDKVSIHPDWTVVPASADLYVRGMDLHRQSHDKSWSLTDCIAFVLMREHKISRALAHDHHFEQAGFEALLRRDPL